ncbi:MAG: hotdog fold thioesterase [Desulfobacterales bacterium]|nr:hotdog fold thioesterase [Desulfobacterales bacterium]
MRIWKVPGPIDLAALNRFSHNTLVAHLGIEISAVGDDWVQASMPVDHRTHQPMGLLHGGASVALAETVGSVAANLAVAAPQRCVGLEINANHIRSVKRGVVSAVARPIQIGRRIQVWDIRIADENDQTVCVSRLTMAVITP